MRIEKTIVVGNERGVHGRVATRLAGVAAAHDVRLFLQFGQETVECSSILDVLALALARGSAIVLVAEGTAADAALIAATEILTTQDDALHDHPE